MKRSHNVVRMETRIRGKMFSCKRVIHLQDTDATGVLYFAQQLRLALEVFEDFLHAKGQPLSALISDKPYLMPIVHAEADYSSALMVGDALVIELTCEKMGTSSFTLGYRYLDETSQEEKGRATLVHVTTSKETRRAIPIPKELKEILTELSLRALAATP